VNSRTLVSWFFIFSACARWDLSETSRLPFPSANDSRGVRLTCFFSGNRDSYAFVTFRYKCDTFTAIEQGNDDPTFPSYTLCFGGRREFCEVEYEDLGESSFAGSGYYHTGFEFSEKNCKLELQAMSE